MQFKGCHVRSKIVHREFLECDDRHNFLGIFSKFIILRGIGLERFSHFNRFTWHVFGMGSMSTDAEFGAEFGGGGKFLLEA